MRTFKEILSDTEGHIGSLENHIRFIESQNQQLRQRLHLSKRDNRNNRDKLRRQVEQATTHGFTDEQLWGFDYALAKVILSGLLRFREINTNSHPGGMTQEEWREILDKIIWSFNEKANDEPNYPQDVFKVLSKEETYDSDGVRQYYERIQDGFTLFGQWYQHLWD